MNIVVSPTRVTNHKSINFKTKQISSNTNQNSKNSYALEQMMQNYALRNKIYFGNSLETNGNHDNIEFFCKSIDAEDEKLGSNIHYKITFYENGNLKSYERCDENKIPCTHSKEPIGLHTWVSYKKNPFNIGIKPWKVDFWENGNLKREEYEALVKFQEYDEPSIRKMTISYKEDGNIETIIMDDRIEHFCLKNTREACIPKTVQEHINN